ncbi:MAG: hypothetical protein EBY16_03785 [Gammaproteobacteria bacterium]|nr:hypothetical protein [Gammaproteobacteria bacterium]
MGDYSEALNQKMLNGDETGYKRELYQSYMTGPEWRNVEMVAEYGQFLKQGRSMFQFVYFSQLAELWKVLYHAYASARRHQSISEIFFSEYMLMDLFVVFFTTLELLPKGFLSLLLYPFLKAENNTQMQAHLAEFYIAYANQLETIPFYDHDYNKLRTELREKYIACSDRTWVDWFSWTAISIELRAKTLLSIPLSYMFHQDADKALVTTDILVKCNVKDVADPVTAKDHFNDKLSEIKKHHQVTLVGEVEVKDKKEDKDHISTYARLRVPRYKAFKPLLEEMALQGIFIQKIAGQDLVQVKCEIKSQNIEAMKACEAALNQKENVTSLYTYSDRINPNYKVCLFEVPVKNLHDALEKFEEDTQASVSFIHNF